MDGMLLSKMMHMSLIGCYSMLVVMFVRLFLRKIGRKYCYYLWLIVFLNLCIPFSVFSSFSLIPEQLQNIEWESDEVSGEVANTSLDATGTEPGKVIVLSPNKLSIDNTEAQAAANTMQEKFMPQERISVPLNWQQIRPFAEKIWLLGILCFVLYSVGVARRLKRNILQAEAVCLDEQDRIWKVNGLVSPFLWGLLNPTIYLPSGLSGEEEKYIISHEKCHRKRKDYLIKIAVYAVTVLHWFNPSVWIAYSLFCKDMEISCDEAVLEKADENIRKAYAHSLLKYAAKQNRYVMTPITFGEPSVQSRITNVLKYRKKGILLSVFAVIISVLVALGLFMRPAKQVAEKDLSTYHHEIKMLEDEVADYEAGSEAASMENEEKAESEPEQFTVENNGGEVIRVGSDVFYMNGQKLYSDGRELYTTVTGDDGVEYIYRYHLDGSGFCQMMEGKLVGAGEDKEELYYLATGGDNKTQFNIFNTSFMDVHQVYDSEAEYLTVTEDWVYTYHKVKDCIYFDRAQLSQENVEKNVLGLSVWADEVTSFFVGDYIVFAAGRYEGSGGYFYGDFYSFNPETRELKQEHMTDSDEFFVVGDYIYFQSYGNQKKGGNDLYRAKLDLTGIELIGESMEFLQADTETGTLLVSKDGQLLRISPDGKDAKCLFDSKAAGVTLAEYDKLMFKEINIVGEDIYLKAERWGYQEGNGWRDSLIESMSFKIKADGSGFEVYNPEEASEETEETIGFMDNPIPGLPCENPKSAGWDLQNIRDVRLDFSALSPEPAAGTENNTYLLGKTEQYTLYGKGDYYHMLLEYNGLYAEIYYPFTSNYMIQPMLLEADLDSDGTNELAITYNIKHGTGYNVDTLFVADIRSDGQIYVYQFLDKDFVAQLMKHVSFSKSYTKTAEGMQALVDGKAVGYLMKEDETTVYKKVSAGSIVGFEFVENEIQTYADLEFYMDANMAAVPFGNYSDITATVLWDGDGNFKTQNFISRNRYMESLIRWELEKEYRTPNIIVKDITYDSAKMNAETLTVTAAILPEGADSYDYAECKLSRDERANGGWKLDELVLEK